MKARVSFENRESHKEQVAGCARSPGARSRAGDPLCCPADGTRRACRCGRRTGLYLPRRQMGGFLQRGQKECPHMAWTPVKTHNRTATLG